MDLLALPARLPFLDGRVGATDELVVGLDLVHLDSLALDAPGLGAARRVVMLVGVDALLLGAGQRAPAQLLRENLLDLVRDKHPHGREAQLGKNKLDECGTDVLVL